MAKPRRTHGRWALRAGSRLLAVCLVSGFSLLVLEGAVRLLMPAYDPAGQIDFVLADGFPLGPPGFVGRLWRNTGDYDVEVRINADGFRDRKDLRDSAAEDIFVVGDSFSFGWGVEESERYSNRLETLFGLPVYSIAIPTDFDGYAHLIEHARERGGVIRRLVVGVCMENDLRRYGSRPEDRAEPPRQAAPLSPSRVKYYLTRHSAFYNAATAAVHRDPTLRRLMSRIGVITESVDGMNWNVDDPEIIAESTARLARLIAESGAQESLVLLIPSRGLWQGPNRDVERRVHAAVVAALGATGLHVLDMRPLMEKGGDPLANHFPSDGHWNVAGHNLAARAIYDYCRSVSLFGRGEPVPTNDTTP